jgi:hypothetical protein
VNQTGRQSAVAAVAFSSQAAAAQPFHHAMRAGAANIAKLPELLREP